MSDYVQAKAQSLDAVNKKLICESTHGKEIFEVEYDKLVIAVGVKTNTFGIQSIQASSTLSPMLPFSNIMDPIE
jgi:NADH dehydrogenase FAD-containing subunit